MDRVTQADIDPRDQECVRAESFNENESVFLTTKSLSDTKSFSALIPRRLLRIPSALGLVPQRESVFDAPRSRPCPADDLAIVSWCTHRRLHE